MASRLALQIAGVNSTMRVASALAARTASIAALALLQAMAVSSEEASPRSVAMALQAVAIDVSISLAVTLNLPVASSKASIFVLPKFEFRLALRSCGHWPGTESLPQPTARLDSRSAPSRGDKEWLFVFIAIYFL
jgi:hypothetical protein